MFESVEDNPYLEDFYKDMKRYSFPLQVYFLNHRSNAHRIIDQNNFSAIQDRSIYEDAHIFAKIFSGKEKCLSVTLRIILIFIVQLYLS